MRKTVGAWIRYTLLAALLLTAVLLMLPQREQTVSAGMEPEATTEPALAVEKRLSRQEAYEKDLEALQVLAQNGDTLAVERLEKMIRLHQNELAIEEALQASGFADVLVIAQGNAVAVMLPQEQLTQENSARILTLCMTYADVSAENIRIMDY